MRKAIPRVVIAGTQSGSGKTTLVTGLLSALRAKGLRVQSYKVGPDYIDPGFHQLASGRPAHNLDTWLVPEEKLPALFASTMEDADLAIIEGVMGLYDGGRKGVSSTAEIAKFLHAPVLLVIDCKSVGASAAAVALGFRAYDAETEIAGVLCNRLGSETHEQMVRQAMEGIDMPVYGAIHRDDSLHLPERHLGLTPTTEVEAAGIVQKMGEAVGRQTDIESLLALANAAEPLEVFSEPLPPSQRGGGPRSGGGCVREAGVRLAVAHDAAFSFYYKESLAVLESCGAELVPFSPLEDAALPENISGAIFGGGFPEMFARELSANETMRASIRTAADRGLPIYAECGGYMYLFKELADFDGTVHPMCGVFAGRAAMTKRLQMVGYVTARLQEDTILGAAGTKLRGHEFHFSQELEREEPVRPFQFTKLRNGMTYSAGQMQKNALGSYLHLHFAGCPEAAANFVTACRAWKEGTL